MQVELNNDTICAVFDTHGAELKSLKKDGREYMWNADPAYWNRTSPVLFPFVGAVRDGEYRYHGYTYPMGQHGFARDMEFEIAGETNSSVSFRLEDTPETKKVYPFSFELTIVYALNNNKLQITWMVKNLDEKTMYFSIGAHPAFLVEPDEQGTMAGNYLRFDSRETLVATDFSDGYVLHTTHEIRPDEEGFWELDEHTFDNGVHILEHDQVQRISIADRDKKPYITVEFNSPLVGIWSPEKKNAPFLCIEPWYGRADAVDFTGDLEERKYGRSLEPGEVFSAGYQVVLE